MISFKRYSKYLFVLFALVLTGCGSGGGGGGGSGSTASNSGGGTGGGGGGGGATITCNTASPGGPSSIVGSWYFGDTSNPNNNNLVVATFFSDGTYTLADDGDSITDPSGTDGMERGTYTWDATTGAFTVTPTVDTDGQWGFSNPPSNMCVQVTGDALSFTTSSVNESVVLTRVADVADSIVGSWYLGNTNAPNDLLVFTFFSDGTYTLADDNDPAVDPNGQDGMERGAYTWNSTTGAFTSITTVNTDGQWGISSPGCDNVQVSGNALGLSCGADGTFTFTRVTPPS